jgi:tetratricopeptide (TPR) repeat protein
MVLGESEQRAGLASSRETLLDAAGLAKLRGDADGLAQAALANSRGFFSHTGRVDRERVAVLEDAIEAVDPEDGPVRARLLATLSSELMWADDGDRRFALSDEALAIARRLQDARTLAHVLILRSIAITAPDTLDTRVVDTGQLAEVADLLDDPVVHFHAAHAQLRLAVDIPDRDALDEALARMASLAEQLRQPALSWLAALALASDDFFRGDLEGAEKRALEGLRLGDRAGQPEAVMFGGAQLLFVRRLQGRLPELLDVAVAATNERGADYAHMVALSLCEAGRIDEARERYARVARTGFDLRRDMVTGASLANLAHLASRLGDVDGAAVLYERLAPYERTIFQAMNAMLVTHHYLGMLAVTMDRDDDADHHFHEAVEVQRDLGAPLYVAETQLEWARALAQRGGADNIERARALATEARRVAGERGAVALERGAAAVLEGLRAPGSS